MVAADCWLQSRPSRNHAAGRMGGGFVGVATVADLVERLGVVFAAESPATQLQTAVARAHGGA